jgi:F-type H+-transporting ATPase subunit b
MVRNYLKFIGFFTLLSGECLGAEGGMPQLNPDYWVSQIFWVILIFGILYVILWRTILPKINENLENRKSQILTDLDDAQKFEDQSKEKLSDYNKILNQAKQEAKKILDATKTKVNRDIENKKNQFNLEIKKEIEKAEKEIKTLKLSSIENINKIAIETSSEIVRKIISTEVNASSVSAIVEDISKREITKYI